MIESLTQEQIDLFPRYVDKWLKIGLNTDPVDKAAAQEAVKLAYKSAGLSEPTQFLWARSPLDAIKVIKDNFSTDKTDYQLFSDMVYGAHDAGWLSFYNYFLEVVGLECCKDLIGLMDLAKDCGWWNAYNGLAILQEKPIKISMVSGLLHNEKGAAIEYSDGFKIYSLRGIQVPSWVITTPKEEINPTDVLKITDVDVRREVMRHVGMDRLFNLMDKKTLDKDTVNGEQYELVELTLDKDEGVTGKYLKMNNPSIEAVHVEGVPDDISTVKGALKFRNQAVYTALGINGFLPPEVLT